MDAFRDRKNTEGGIQGLNPPVCTQLLLIVLQRN